MKSKLPEILVRSAAAGLAAAWIVAAGPALADGSPSPAPGSSGAVKLRAHPSRVTLLLGSAIQVKVTGSPGPFDVRGCAGKAAASFGGNVLTVQGIGPGGCRLIATDRKNGATVSVRVTVLETSGN